MLKEIPTASQIMLSKQTYDDNIENAITPFIKGHYQRINGFTNLWSSIEIVCFMRVSPEDIKDVKIYLGEYYDFAGDILPMKEVIISHSDVTLSKDLYGWYLKTEPFELSSVYNVLEIVMGDHLSQGKKRGGRTVGISTPLKF